jgi:hypothetical protein
MLMLCVRQITQEKERVQAELRTAHERVEQNAEAIAFQDGDIAEERIANTASDEVMDFLQRENTQNSAWSAVNMFMMWRVTHYIKMSLEFYWSLGQGTDTDVLANRGVRRHTSRVAATTLTTPRTVLCPLSSMPVACTLVNVSLSSAAT